jgi:hypothetical protein
MKIKASLQFLMLLARTPSGMAALITALYGLLFFLASQNENENFEIYYIIIFSPVLFLGLKFGCLGGIWGDPSRQCISDSGSVYIVIFSIIFLILWLFIKIVLYLKDDGRR